MRTAIAFSLLSLFQLKNKTLRAAWQIAGKEAPASLADALALMRHILTLQAVFYQINGRHADTEEAISLIIKHRTHWKVSEARKGWMKIIQLRDEVIPGWRLDMASGPSAATLEKFNSGFRVILTNIASGISLISDDDAVIYASREPQPAAATLPSAREANGAAERISNLRPSMTWGRIKDFFALRSVLLFPHGNIMGVEGAKRKNYSRSGIMSMKLRDQAANAQGSGGARAGRTPNGGHPGVCVWNCQVEYCRLN